MNKINNIGIFTSGGDSPGMNAAIRAVVKAAKINGIKTTGIIKGYEGMIDGKFVNIDEQAVNNISHCGGTILKTARSPRFLTIEGRQQALLNLQNEEIDALIAIGGDGTFKGLLAFSEISNLPVIGIPGTIDNDLTGTDFTLGFDTAVNTALESIDKIRDTADAHERIFIVEVMGRDAGYIAINSGIASGAEGVLIPESTADINRLIEMVKKGWRKEHSSLIIIVSEGDETGVAEVAHKLKLIDATFDIRITILGHVQRGGNPSYADRLLGAKLGVTAVKSILNNETNKMVGIIRNQMILTPFENVVKQHTIDKEMFELMELLT